MEERTNAPDASRLEVPIDAWTQPFWEAAAAGELRLPRCGGCGSFRWPPGPFCPHCRSQEISWTLAGPARIYSFTLVPNPPVDGRSTDTVYAPSLIEFPEAGGLRIIAAIIDAVPDDIEIGRAVEVGWTATGNTRMPVFRLVD